MPKLADEAFSDGMPTLLSRIRNMWEFANLCQWIYIFGKAVQIDESIDIEALEMECLKPHSKVLSDIAFALIKLASLRQGLTFDALDDQLRKQYLAKAPDDNPLGDENNPLTFASLDIFRKIRVLQTLTQWIMSYPERIRNRMSEQKETEQMDWRIEPYGWDSQDRVYYVLDDNRIYRFTECPINITKSNKETRELRRTGTRASPRYCAASSGEASGEGLLSERPAAPKVGNGLGGKWECIAITLQEVQLCIETLSRSHDENERILRNRIKKHLLPILEKQEELTRRKRIQRERELLNLSKLANAKRSSRIAGRTEKQRQEEEEREQRRRKHEAEQAERSEKQAQMKAEQERESRAFSRHQRLHERDIRRRQYTEELAHLSQGSKGAVEAIRISDRQIQAEIERKRQALQDISQEEDDWVFDCTCGLYGRVDDGTHSISCGRCSIWQHSKCVGVSEQEAEQPSFQFTCKSCRGRLDEQSRAPNSVIKLKVRPFDAKRGVLQSNGQSMSSLDSGEGEIVSTQDSTTKDGVCLH
ncbi:hypothetical protein E4U09_004313 [Claviceps aff. purpurea]|uniref:Zinc finger PHD-type domain-containing protein n=1 Tax=Claviceps aff. purpurea TaxID=1967640 RepID=A0A9P7U1F3_9HYPO|nr:hypothetical protein E4U09_004313 [Claviceps aff. purpurea]